jgi:hypothetical protein
VGAVVALALATQVDQAGNVSVARELRLVLADLRDRAPLPAESKSEELRRRRRKRVAHFIIVSCAVSAIDRHSASSTRLPLPCRSVAISLQASRAE